MALDFIYIFFVLKEYPDNYGACRLWERERSEWCQFYGSNYNPYQRHRLRRKVHPFHLEEGFRDKEVCDVLFRGLGIPTPRTMGIIEPGDQVRDKLSGILSATDRVIIKPVRGHAGLGVALASNQAGRVQVRERGALKPVNQYKPPGRCLVQEVVTQSPTMAQFAPSSLNTLRLLTMLTKSGEVIVVGASMRFGVGEAIVDNWSAGGVAVGVDYKRACLMASAFDKRGNRFTHHPVTGLKFEGFVLPRWNEVMELGTFVQRSFSFFKLLGMDLAFSEDGVILIEINNDADLVFQEQTSGPLLGSRKTWKAFREYDLLYNQKQQKLFHVPSREHTTSK